MTAARRSGGLSAAEEAERVAVLAARTPEQRAEDARQVAEAVEEMRRQGPGGLGSSGGNIAEAVAAAVARAEDLRRERLALPCYAAMYPSGAEPEGDDAERADDAVGARACREAGAHRGCEWRFRPEGSCPLERCADREQATRQRLRVARVPREDYDLVLGIYAGLVRPLELDSLRLARAVARRRRAEVELENGAEVLSGGRERPGMVVLRGDERFVVVGGNVGRGKSIAAQLLLAHFGGLYTLEYGYGVPRREGGVDLREAMAAPVLVVDQFGRANRGESAFLVANIEQVLDVRRGAGRLTVLAGNFRYEDLVARYEAAVVDRIAGYGVLVLLGGESVRAGLRGES